MVLNGMEAIQEIVMNSVLSIVQRTTFLKNSKIFCGKAKKIVI